MILFMWTHAEEERKIFLRRLSEFNPSIKFTRDPKKQNITFLKFKVSLRKGKTITDVYVKPTDCHQYLLYSLARHRTTLKI